MIDKTTARNNNIKTIDNNAINNDKQQQLLSKLKELLPTAISSDNTLNINALQEVLGKNNITSKNQGYGLNFAGKGLARATADIPTKLEFKTEKEQSKNFDTTNNTIIRGDNLEVLKLLYANYHNSIKMIYIDPPYNTKSENFVYKDNFKVSDEELIEHFNIDENDINFLQNVYGTRSHSGWLSFIYPRLKLARDLLTDDGVIFISIDDNEQANLKIICDEIFGEDNFLCDFPRLTKKGGKSSEDLAKNHDNILSYSKSKNVVINALLHQDEGFKYEDEFVDKRGKFKLNQTLDYGSIQYSKSLDYEINIDNKIFRPGNVSKEEMLTRQNTNPKSDFCWRWSKELFEFGLNNGFIVIKDRIYTKTYLKAKIIKENGSYKVSYNDRVKSMPTIELIDSIYSNDNSKKDLKKLNLDTVFQYPKGTKLLKKLISIGANQDDTILDFFAGSGTTADSVMQLNAEDRGKRKFILVQLDEDIGTKISGDEFNELDAKSQKKFVFDKKNNCYRDTSKQQQAYDFCLENNFNPVISSITIERVNRVGEKILKDNAESKTPKDLKKLDIGYKVLSLASKPQVITSTEQEELFTINNPRKSSVDVLFNMMNLTGKAFDSEIIEIKKDVLYKIDDEVYVLQSVANDELKQYKNLKINIDGWADINLEEFLNLNTEFKDNISVIY